MSVVSVEELVLIHKRLDSIDEVQKRIEDRLEQILSLDNFMNEAASGMVLRGVLGEDEDEPVEDSMCKKCLIM